MKKNDEETPSNQRWAEFRFSVVGRLLASPPKKGELQEELKQLAQKAWKHPISGDMTQLGFSTIETWYYQARNERMYPVDVLKTKIRSDSGRFKSIDQPIKDYVKEQYLQHKSWSYKLHADNVNAVFGKDSPSYGTIRRFMKRGGLFKKRRLKKKFLAKPDDTEFEKREVRGFENEYTNGLWHADYHHSSLQIITKEGKWVTPVVLAILDDHSRLACHVQWYLAENTKNLVHAFSQAVLKRTMPRSFITDNGSPFTSNEFTQGLTRLGIIPYCTLPYSPWQNGKQERFFGSLEKRLMDMLENKKDLTLKELNDYTIVWMEMEYNRSENYEIKCSPIERFSKDKDVGRPSPSMNELQMFFCRQESRRQRFNDGTISLKGKRYEIPSRYRTLEVIWVRYAEWDLSFVHMVDAGTGTILERLYPIDKIKNANQGRRIIQDEAIDKKAIAKKDEVAPLLKKYMDEYNINNHPISYLAQDEHL